jgi:hypothetical protein
VAVGQKYLFKSRPVDRGQPSRAQHVPGRAFIRAAPRVLRWRPWKSRAASMNVLNVAAGMTSGSPERTLFMAAVKEYPFRNASCFVVELRGVRRLAHHLASAEDDIRHTAGNLRRCMGRPRRLVG